MHSAISDSVGLVAYLALFAGVGILFVFVNLLVGRFLRPNNPTKRNWKSTSVANRRWGPASCSSTSAFMS